MNEKRTAWILAIVFGAAVQANAATPEQKCQATKNKVAGKYAACRQNAEKGRALTGDAAKYGAAIAKCESVLATAWQKAIDVATAAGATCPDAPLAEADFKQVIDAHTDNVAAGLAGEGVCNVVCAAPLKVFVSSQTYNGNLGGLAGADAKCQALAAAAGLGGSYAAWLSDGTASAGTRLVPAGVSAPYELVNGTHVANNFGDLINGDIAAPIDRDETGALVASARAWTGTAPAGGTTCYRGNTGVCGSASPGMDSGVTRSMCNDWTAAVSLSESVTGIAATDGRWTLEGDRACPDQHHLYCIGR